MQTEIEDKKKPVDYKPSERVRVIEPARLRANRIFDVQGALGRIVSIRAFGWYEIQLEVYEKAIWANWWEIEPAVERYADQGAGAAMFLAEAMETMFGEQEPEQDRQGDMFTDLEPVMFADLPLFSGVPVSVPDPGKYVAKPVEKPADALALPGMEALKPEKPKIDWDAIREEQRLARQQKAAKKLHKGR